MAAALPPTPETLEELNARIDLVELRVVRRDLEFRHHTQSLERRGKALLSPSHWLKPLIGAGSGWLFWRLLRRRPVRDDRPSDRAARRAGGLGTLGVLGLLKAFGVQAPAGQGPTAAPPQGAGTPPPPHAADKGHGAKPELALLQMLTMAWSFLPAGIRQRLGPESTQLLLGVLAGVVHGLQRRRHERREAEGADAQAEAQAAAASVRAGAASAPAGPSGEAREATLRQGTAP